MPKKNHRNDFVLSRRLLNETESRPLYCIFREFQLLLYEHSARCPKIDSAQRVVSVRDNPEWKRPVGCQWASGLRKSMDSAMRFLRLKGGLLEDSFGEFHGVRRRKEGEATPPYACPYWLID